MTKVPRMTRLFAWFLLVGGMGPWASGGQPRAAADNANDLIRQALQSEQRLGFGGQRLEIAWADGVSVAALVQEYRTADGKRRVECRIPGRVRADVFIENGQEVWYSCPTHFIWQQHGLLSLPFPQLWQLVRENYAFRCLPGGLDHVAQRPTVAIEARPREARKGFFRLWLDRDHRFILKIERYRADGSLVSKSAFETIRFNPPLKAELFAIQRTPLTPDQPSWQPTTRQELQAQLGPGAALPTRLPYGYYLQELLRKREDETGRVQAHLLYTDGLDTLSLFAVRPAPPRDWRQLERVHLLERWHGQPAWVNREGRFFVLTWQVGDVEQSLVTELPAEAVRALADEIIPRHAPPRPLLRQRHPRAWFPALLAATLVFLLLRRCLRPRWL